MGHAGAIISGGKGIATEKVAVMRECGISVADSPAEMAQAFVLLRSAQGFSLRYSPDPLNEVKGLLLLQMLRTVHHDNSLCRVNLGHHVLLNVKRGCKADEIVSENFTVDRL